MGRCEGCSAGRLRTSSQGMEGRILPPGRAPVMRNSPLTCRGRLGEVTAAAARDEPSSLSTVALKPRGAFIIDRDTRKQNKTAILDHLDQVSVFGPSSLALFLILGLDWVFSSVHAYEEWRGEEAPLSGRRCRRRRWEAWRTARTWWCRDRACR